MTLVTLFRKVRYCCQTIFEKSGNLAGLFLESWIILLNFFANPQNRGSIFFRDRPARDRKFSEKSAGGRTELPGFGNGSRGWGLSPPYPHERGVPPPPTGRPRGGSGRRKLHLPSEGPMRRPSDSERKRGGGGIIFLL